MIIDGAHKSCISKSNISKLNMIIDGAHKSCRASDTWKRMIAWHYVGICRACRATGVGPTSNQRLAIKLARWAKWHWANVICRRRANKTADKMPALVQRMIAIWDNTNHFAYMLRRRWRVLQMYVCLCRTRWSIKIIS